MCHIILCFEVLFLHIPAVWHAKMEKSQLDGVCVHSPVILSFKEWRSIKHT